MADTMEVAESGDADPHRLVHLDLKGAPPKISYYEQLFPYLKKWGATGLLVEYEDMFPYCDNLSDIAAHNAYSPTEINSLLELAQANDLIVIPLVQTFGHFEFVLKHEKYRHLREIEPYPMALCPTNPDCLPLVLNMIDQVIQRHPTIKYFHIGADEVFHLGICAKCQSFCHETGGGKTQLFFSHVKRLLEQMKVTYPNIRAIMWDDMFRATSVEEMQAFDIGTLVEPMVWYYERSFDHLQPEMWKRYSQVFPHVWAASAFKGATGPCKFATDIGYHVVNHQGWITTVKDTVIPNFVKFKGYALTGWQRYDHYSVLCELLPAGLPSLAICLSLLTRGSFTEELHQAATEDLKFAERIPLDPFNSVGHIPACDFPGYEVYVGVQVLLHLKVLYKQLMRNDRINGWMTDYHVRHNFTNPAHLNHFLPQARELFYNFHVLHTDLQAAMTKIFYPDCVNEWLAVNVNPKYQKVRDIVEKAESQIQLQSGPKTTSEEFPGGENPTS